METTINGGRSGAHSEFDSRPALDTTHMHKGPLCIARVPNARFVSHHPLTEIWRSNFGEV